MEEKKEKIRFPVTPSEYKLLEEVGQGVSGLVYRAVCVALNEVIAIKKLDLEKCNGSLDNIRKEAQTMTLISHPNVVRAHCSFVVGQNLWVVMPYMGGGSCLHIMKAAFPDGFDEPVIATILRETLKALEYLHRHGHIHRDVKAGNILMDENGGVKLGDFGVAACMFDNGDRQWARNTFVGTPCWMAPEVMEQLNGYDFKADIWSFGITALELAHGHAPFSKYPPMKVLLMTLQNAPPGLTYERDRKFSKSFKEMIAMCLVKDPAKRPSAEKLLKHSFFKYAKSSEYLARHVLYGLSSLWERVKDVKLKDAARLAEKKMPYGEQEERSQKEYKRGVSGWNFDVEDLKAQAALIQDDEFIASMKREDDESAKTGGCKVSETLSRVASPLDDTNHQHHHHHRLPEITIEDEDCVLRTASLPNGAKIKGRFNVFVDNVEIDTSNWNEVSSDHQQHTAAEECGAKEIAIVKDDDVAEDKEENKEKDEHHIIEQTLTLTCRTSDDERDLHVRSVTEKTANGVLEHRPSTTKPPAGPKDEEKKAPVVQKKGRFSVTSADVDLNNFNKEEVISPSASLRKTSSAQQVTAQSSASVASSTAAIAPPVTVSTATTTSGGAASSAAAAAAAATNTTSTSNCSGILVSTLLAYLQNLLNQTAVQQDMIIGLMASVGSDAVNGGSGQRLSRSVSANGVDCEIVSERERELRQQVGDLQGRVVNLVDEMQMVKLRNVQLERQLNAIFNKEEEERIRKEEAAKEDG